MNGKSQNEWRNSWDSSAAKSASQRARSRSNFACLSLLTRTGPFCKAPEHTVRIRIVQSWFSQSPPPQRSFCHNNPSHRKKGLNDQGSFCCTCPRLNKTITDTVLNCSTPLKATGIPSCPSLHSLQSDAQEHVLLHSCSSRSPCSALEMLLRNGWALQWWLLLTEEKRPLSMKNWSVFIWYVVTEGNGSIDLRICLEPWH